MVESIVQAYESIEEIERTSSKFVIATVKNERHVLNNFDHDTLVDALTEN